MKRRKEKVEGEAVLFEESWRVWIRGQEANEGK
jgi:hypothetical protein